jgi:hypothetical protein
MEENKMLDFYKTGGGRKLFDSTLPEIGRQLKRVADQLERANDLKEKELGIQKQSTGEEMTQEEKEKTIDVSSQKMDRELFWSAHPKIY